ncbi:MAG: FUSC family protein [Clostridium sp.]|uniref:FUSC family protein n=1 Tax=Clostridium sp. TaxID=1506 RepID=UPI003F3DA848
MMKKQLITATSLTLVSTLILAAVYSLFGKENIVLALAVIIAIMNLAKKDFTIKPKNEFIKLLVGFISLAVFSELANINIYFGIILNAIFLFTIGALYLDDLDNGYYYAFTNLYLYTLVFSVDTKQFPIRLLGVIFCAVLIMVLKLYVIKVNFKNKKVNLLVEMIDITNSKIENLSENKNKVELNIKLEKLSNTLENLLNNSTDSNGNFIYQSKYLFDVLIMIEKINLEIDKGLNYKKNEELLNSIERSLAILKLFITGELNIDGAISKLDEEKNSSSKCNCNGEKLNICLIESMIISIRGYSACGKEQKSLFEEIKITLAPKKIVEKIVNSFKEREEIFYFNIRMVLAVTITYGVGRVLNLEYYYWMVFSAFVVIQVNLRDTLLKGFKRLKGTIIGAGMSVIIFQYVDNMNIKIALIIIAVFCATLFKSYDKLMIFTTICTLGVKDIMSPSLSIIGDRLIFVFVGITISIILTYIIKPYKFSDEYNKKLIKIKENDRKIFNFIREKVAGCNNVGYNNIREIMLQNTLMINYLNTISDNESAIYIEFKMYHNRISVNSAFLYKLVILKEKVDLDNYLKKGLLCDIEKDIGLIFNLKSSIIK